MHFKAWAAFYRNFFRPSGNIIHEYSQQSIFKIVVYEFTFTQYNM